MCSERVCLVAYGPIRNSHYWLPPESAGFEFGDECDGEGKVFELAAVAVGDDSPVFEVGDTSFDGAA
jgi:hypothetical protein